MIACQVVLRGLRNRGSRMSRTGRLLLLPVIWSLAVQVFAAGGVRRIAAPGEPVSGPSVTMVSSPGEDGTSVATAATPWPEGVLQLVNDPLRTDGWNPWFTGFPNHVEVYDFAVQTPSDVNRLVSKFASIGSRPLRLHLSPLASKDRVTTVGAQFSLGNQALLDHWRNHRTSTRIDFPPAALPPTLTLFCGHPAVDLSVLRIPPHVEVVTEPDGAGPMKGEVATTATARGIEAFPAGPQYQERAK